MRYRSTPQAISGISPLLGSDKLSSGSAHCFVHVWDCNSGKGIDVIMGGKIFCMITHGLWVFVGITKSMEAWNTQTGMKSSPLGPSGCLLVLDMIASWLGPVAILSGHERDEIQSSWTFWLFAGTGHGCIMTWTCGNPQWP